MAKDYEIDSGSESSSEEITREKPKQARTSSKQDVTQKGFFAKVFSVFNKIKSFASNFFQKISSFVTGGKDASSQSWVQDDRKQASDPPDNAVSLSQKFIRNNSKLAGVRAASRAERSKGNECAPEKSSEKSDADLVEGHDNDNHHSPRPGG